MFFVTNVRDDLLGTQLTSGRVGPLASRNWIPSLLSGGKVHVLDDKWVKRGNQSML